MRALTALSRSVSLQARSSSRSAPRADSIIGLVITLVILRITWESWHTVRAAEIDFEHVGDDHHGYEHD
jgi:hypothetical protein